MKKFITTFLIHNFSSDRNIGMLMRKWRLQGKQIPLSSFEADSADIAGSGLPGNHSIHLYIITHLK